MADGDLAKVIDAWPALPAMLATTNDTAPAHYRKPLPLPVSAYYRPYAREQSPDMPITGNAR